MSTSKDLESKECNPFSTSKFLKDVFMCSLVAFGGPEAHLGVFLDRMVEKKKYLSKKALLEWMALCSFLPGPTSTQVITAIGLEKGGRKLALLTLLIWAFPAICLMTFISLIPNFLNDDNHLNLMGFLPPMAAGFIAWAAWVLGRKVCANILTFLLWFFGLIIPLISGSPWIIPFAFLLGGILSVWFSPNEDNRVEFSVYKLSMPWGMLLLFTSLLLGGILGSKFTEHTLLQTFERFFRYGYLVFGGGQVVVPLMQGELVNSARLMTQDDFLTGFGLVQAIPGPMFSFAAYAGGLSEQDSGIMRQCLSSIISGFSIFLPGTILLFIVYPFWEKLKSLSWAHRALKGVNAMASGLVAGVFFNILIYTNWCQTEIICLVLSIGLLISRKIHAPYVLMIVGLVYCLLD